MTIITRAKTQEENLCDTCRLSTPECDAEKGLLEYGNGVGNDNIIACPSYEPNDK